MLHRRRQEPFFSDEDIPIDYLSMPVEDCYNPTLERFNASRRSMPDFGKTTFKPNTEKLYRLYFYQGMSKPDRLLVHAEFLENNADHVYASSTAIALTIGAYIITGFTNKYSSFSRVRMGFALLTGWVCYDIQRKRAANKLVRTTAPLYAKYQIK
mmetsp:Transcript_4826/g.9008  ORF Transcript_4826/g.9008 Transcript_4826/m.9008 type:complete len:155 (+) Transcript_4826:433-897(+)